MKRVLMLAAALVFAAGFLAAQNGAAPPPSDVGIGNSTMSPTGSGAAPSMSPDQNQRMTNQQGSTTGDRNQNSGLAGSSGLQTGSAANSEGTTSTSSSTSATAGRRLPHAKGAAKANRKQKGTTQSGDGQGNTVSSPVYPSGGPSTTEAPGPATGVTGNRNVPQGGNGQYSGTSSQQTK
jgi:hypothetical protein